jgi:dCMP deaminase
MKRIELDEAYLQMAEIWAQRSKANRMKVGALIVKGTQIISDGYNGMPAGAEDDCCEHVVDGELKTRPEVVHAEANAILKAARYGGMGLEGATLYVTLSPCIDCAKMIVSSKISKVVFRTLYRSTEGIDFLRKYGVTVERKIK